MVLFSLSKSRPWSFRCATRLTEPEVAHRDLVGRGVEGDLGAQVGAVHHADVLLRAAQVARVLEGDPGMPGLEQHRQHLAPQLHRGDLLVQLELAARRLVLVAQVGLLEGLAELVVQLAARPTGENSVHSRVFHHPLHEQVRNPVGRVHVVGAAPVVAGVLAQLEELLDVEVPGLEVGADRALALAALVHRHRGVVHHLEERHHALRLAVGALDVRAERAHRRPVVAQAAGVLGEQRVFLDRVVDAVEVVGHRGQVAAGELRAQRAGVEQRRRRAHEVEGRQHVVELDRARLAVLLVQRQAHRHAHEEGLRQLDALAVARAGSSGRTASAGRGSRTAGRGRALSALPSSSRSKRASSGSSSSAAMPRSMNCGKYSA